MSVNLEFVFKADLTAQIESALSIVEAVPARDLAEEVYRHGFRAALLAIAVTNSLDVPRLRNATTYVQLYNQAKTIYDGRP